MRLLFPIAFVLLFYSCSDQTKKDSIGNNTSDLQVSEQPNAPLDERKEEDPKSITINQNINNTQSKKQSKKKKGEANLTKKPASENPSGWEELNTVVPDVVLDMRYATTNNFVHQVMYPCPRCFVKNEVAKALKQVQFQLNEKKEGYRLKMFDCYRPSPVQQKLWEIVPDPNYVTPPEKGSMHNRGLAVDITIVDKNGQELDMGTEFDFFGKEAHYDFTDLPAIVLENRRLLRRLMEAQGFKGIRTEWWHFSLNVPGSVVAKWEWTCEN